MDFLERCDDLVLKLFSAGANLYQNITGRTYNEDKYFYANFCHTASAVIGLAGLIESIAAPSNELIDLKKENKELFYSWSFIKSAPLFVSMGGYYIDYWFQKFEKDIGEPADKFRKYKEIFAFLGIGLTLCGLSVASYVADNFNSSESTSGLFRFGLSAVLSSVGLYISRVNIPPPLPPRKSLAYQL